LPANWGIWYFIKNEYTSYWTLVGAAQNQVLRVREPSASTEGCLIHFEGPLFLEDDSLFDPDLIISSKKLLVSQKGEMYSWHISSDKRDKHDPVQSSLDRKDKLVWFCCPWVLQSFP
jgi:hypothetical protein